jgi:hypothetical protein
VSGPYSHQRRRLSSWAMLVGSFATPGLSISQHLDRPIGSRSIHPPSDSASRSEGMRSIAKFESIVLTRYRLTGSLSRGVAGCRVDDGAFVVRVRVRLGQGGMLLRSGVARMCGVFERFTVPARRVVVAGEVEARSLGHGHVGTEHLLLGLLSDERGVGARALAGLGATLERVRALLAEQPRGAPASTSGQIPFTADAKQTLERSLHEALSLGDSFVGPEHLLLAVSLVEGGEAARLMGELGLDARSIRGAVLELVTQPDYQQAVEHEVRAAGQVRAAAHLTVGQHLRPSVAVVERFYELQRRFYTGEDAVAHELKNLLADDVVWHVPGRSRIAGEYRGPDEVLAYFRKRRELVDATLQVIPRGVLADAERGSFTSPTDKRPSPAVPAAGAPSAYSRSHTSA